MSDAKLYNGDAQIHELYDGDDYIEELYDGDDLIFDAGWDTEVSGTAPIQLPDARPKATTWTIDGESKQGTLPSGYTQLEYIQSISNGSTVPYIDTQYIPTINSKARVKFSPIETNNTGFFGSRLDASSARFSCTTFSNGSTFTFAMTNTTWSNNKTPITLGKIYDCTAYNGKQIINETEYTEATVSSFSTTSTFKLASVSGFDTVMTITVNIKYYLCQLWENGVLVHDFIPAKNSSNVLGMYDTVSGTFFTNAGTGTFTEGPVAPTPTCKLDVYGVGDKTENLFDPSNIKYNGFSISSSNGSKTSGANRCINVFGWLDAGDYIICSTNNTIGGYLHKYSEEGTDSSFSGWVGVITLGSATQSGSLYCKTFTLTERCYCRGVNLASIENSGNIMLVKGNSAPTEYIPYGYKVPIKKTVNGIDTIYNIYLPAPLNKKSTYKDSINSNGELKRNVGVITFDGSNDEAWTDASSGDKHIYYAPIIDRNAPIKAGYCTHFVFDAGTSSTCPDLHMFYYGSQNTGFRYDAITTLSDWKTFLSNNPITVHYIKTTETTTQIEVPEISTSRGTNYIDCLTEVQPSNMSWTYRKRTEAV